MQIEDFDDLYAKLNEQQKEAVNQIDGPVMVIAGPGTGKTQILAARILNILRQTDARPEEILCLTYTEAGAANMKKRLLRFMGNDAYKVNIHTFHGLCNKIIRDNSEKFSFKELRVMEELERIDILNRLISELPADSVLKSYAEDPSFLRKQLSTFFSIMQEENYGAQELGNWATALTDREVFKETFPEMVYKVNRGNIKAGDLKENDYQKMTQNWLKLTEAARLFDNYNTLKAELGVFEFSDMIHWVVDGLKNDEELLRTCQEQFQYLLVDEYQDTSGIQNEIISQLNSFYADNPNCFVVGDDDQSIYAFQGAHPDNMKSFADQYTSNLKTIVLTSNYRSSSNIVKASGQLIENNKIRLVNVLPGLSKDLSADGENKDVITQIQLHNFRNRYHEAVWLTEEFKRKQNEGASFKDIAVIFPKHKLAENLIELLRLKNIPFSLTRQVDILQESIIRELVNLLQYISEELEFAHKGEYLLYEILHSPLYGLKPYEISQISAFIYQQNKKDQPLYWRDYLHSILPHNKTPELFESTIQNGIVQLWQRIENTMSQAAFLNVPQLIEYLYSEGGFVAYAMRQNEREWGLEVLTAFLDYAISINEKRPFINLGEFIQELQLMVSNSIAIPTEKIIGSEDGIQLTTAHSAKGLEWDHVYIISADKKSWESDRNFGLPFGLSKLIAGTFPNSSSQNEAEAENNYEEKRRLFYVALTRAKKSATISWSNRSADGKDTELIPSQFVVEISTDLPEETKLNKESLLDIRQQILTIGKTPELHGVPEKWLQKQLENFKFSPTTLYALFECGLKFYFQRIVRVPSAPSASAGYGSAVHDALALWVKTGTLKEGARWFSADELVIAFEKELYRHRGNFTRRGFENKLQQGRDLLPQYHATRIEDFKTQKIVVTEKWYESVIDGVLIGGFSDKLVFNGDKVTIVDYKSGNPKYAEKKFKTPKSLEFDEAQLPPQYWFQLGIYHLILANLPGKNWEPVSGMLDLLDKNEAGEFQQLVNYYTTDDLELLKAFVSRGKSKLENMEFLQGCGKCEWCEFAKNTNQVIWVPQTEEERELIGN